jgi:hypothetical protein
LTVVTIYIGTLTSEYMLNVSEDSLVDPLPALDSCLVLAAGAAVQLAQLVQLVLYNHGDVLPVVRVVSLLQPLVHLETKIRQVMYISRIQLKHVH